MRVRDKASVCCSVKGLKPLSYLLWAPCRNNFSTVMWIKPEQLEVVLAPGAGEQRAEEKGDDREDGTCGNLNGVGYEPRQATSLNHF